MAAHVEVEEIRTTKSEKTLALVLAVFLFIGGIWAYARVDDSARAVVAAPAASPSDEAALARAEGARERLFTATERERVALDELTFAREAWRTALDADRSAPQLERAYGEAQAAHADAEQALTAAQAGLAAVEPGATAAGRRIAEAQERAHERQALLGFLFRLLLVASLVASGYLLLGRLRRRGSRYLPLGLAWVGFAAVLALVMAGDYLTDYVDPLRPRAARARAGGHRLHAGCLRRAPALSRPTPPARPRSQGRVSILRLPRARKRALRGLRARSPRRVRRLCAAAARRYSPLRRLRARLTQCARFSSDWSPPPPSPSGPAAAATATV